VAHVIEAAYGAFRTGLSISLVVAGAVILVSGLIAWATLGPARLEHPRLSGDSDTQEEF
jgi:hypothetical protein